ncbi:hypothetical protein [Nocardia araoensis]|uniref:hypothetical protein n=1 Tax=Nocardia araoensis TaxID=228600 RepID=UPI00030C01E2|nr:hypothetical protein [Nocardia araoensis]
MSETNWGPWELDADNYALRIHGVRKVVLDLPGGDYEIDLEECLTAAQTLDWVMQIAGKEWATDDVVAGLVRALNEILSPQAHLCPFGISRTIARPTVRDLVRRAQRARKTRARRRTRSGEGAPDAPR